MLLEFAPILHLEKSSSVEYEVAGHSPGNRKVDWRIEGSDGFAVLLEVKSRAADLIRSFERVEAGERASDGTTPAPDHDTDLLFKSIETKFLPRDPTRMPQGAWIHSALRQDRDQLERSFLRLDPTKVHFAILGSWGAEAHVLSRDNVPRSKIINLLRVKETDRLVFDRAERV